MKFSIFAVALALFLVGACNRDQQGGESGMNSNRQQKMQDTPSTEGAYQDDSTDASGAPQSDSPNSNP